jgi:hypothetical protein
MRERKEITPAVKYFFSRLEQQVDSLKQARESEQYAKRVVPFEEVEGFFRRIMTQNIFIHTVGLNGRPESTILSKAIFSMNRVVRVYYSTSFDESDSGFIRIQPNSELQLIVVERVHGNRTKPEVLYQSRDECHVIRFMIRWLIRRIDWSKTHLHNLELYKQYRDIRKQEFEAKLAEEEAIALEQQMAQAMKKLKKGKV